MNRRKFIGVVGGGVILAAAGGVGYVASRNPRTAREPWDLAGHAYHDRRARALSWAILAPNPHNRQPWLVDLSVPDKATLYVDAERMLPHTDPFCRQITIGLGCFIELARMAAAQEGIEIKTELFPDGSNGEGLDKRPVAVLRFSEGATIDPLFKHVPFRRTAKVPFDTDRDVSQATLDAVLAPAFFTQAAGDLALGSIQPLRKLTREALRIEMETPRTYKESVDLFRVGASEVDANPDGIDFTGPAFELFGAFGMMDKEKLLDMTSATYKQGLKTVFSQTETAKGHLWQVTQTNTREDQIDAGRDWLRINLAATGFGLGIQPLSQALQEYPEMAELYSDVHRRLAPKGGTVQMLARIGYAPIVAPSPRWPLEAKLI